MGDRGHGRPARCARRGRRLRRALPARVPRGLRSRAAPRRRRVGGSCGHPRAWSIRSGPRTAGSACASRRATPTTCSCARCTGADWRERAGAPRGASAPIHGDGGAALARAAPRRRGSPPPGAASPARPGVADRRARLAAHRARARAPRTRSRRCSRPRQRCRSPRPAWWLRGPCDAAGAGSRAAAAPDAVLLDRDGTLVVDVPYNGDPGAVRPMPGRARRARPAARRRACAWPSSPTRAGSPAAC